MPYFPYARIAFSAVLLLVAFTASAQSQEQDHEQLRGLLEKTRDAVNSGQFADLMPLFHDPFAATMAHIARQHPRLSKIWKDDFQHH